MELIWKKTYVRSIAERRIILFLYDESIFFAEGLASVSQQGKWGFINKTGKVLVPVEYETTLHFEDGLAAVKLNNEWGFVNNTGKVAIPFFRSKPPNY